MLIRDADASRDGPACAAIYRPYVLYSAISFEDTAPSDEEFAQRLEQTSRSHPWLIAEVDGRPVGFAYATRHRDRAAYRWAADVAVYVAEGCKRRGVGRALYGALLPLLAHQGLRTVCAGVTLPNAASVALHERCGFALVGVFPRIGFKDGAWRDVGWWQLELMPAHDREPPEPGPPERLESLD